MTLDRTDFTDFFAAVNGRADARPFRWQQRLLDHLITHARWPDRISAPTGSGKSAVVDVHVFATALAAVGVAPRLPRRLVVVVNRRALVDAQFERANHIRDLLREPTYDVTTAVATALASLQTGHEWAVEPADRPAWHAADALLVSNLRGALAPTRGWIDDPASCQVIAATPDMFGSRLLMRGYGTSAQARPREAGLLAYDTVAVVDEAHLSRQLLMTARRIADLEGFAVSSVGVPLLQVVETTATPAGDAVTTVGVEDDDLVSAEDATLRERLTRPKPVSYVDSPAWPTKGKAAKPHVDLLVDTTDVVCNGSDGVVGCIVNRVDTAVRVAKALKDRGRRIAVWVGPRRPDDIADLREKYPQLMVGGLMEGEPLDVLVATQTVEVGIDLDLAHLVTELASASALAQRAGRVNRVGARLSGGVVVVGPAGDPTVDTLPYRRDDLVAARHWLENFVDTDLGLAPWSVRSHPPPVETPRRTLYQRLEMYDAWRLARTSEHLFVPDDLTLWLADDLAVEERTAGVVLRPLPTSFDHRGKRLDLNLAVALLNATPPTSRETFPGRVFVVRQIAERARMETDIACLYRDGEVIALADEDVRGGDVLILPDSMPCTVEGVLADEDTTPECASGTWGDDDRDVHLGDHDLCTRLAGLDAEQAQQRYAELHVGDDRQVIVPSGSADVASLPWVVVRPRRSQLDPETMQESVLSGREVSLVQHQANVRGRARRLAEGVGLSAGLVEAIGVAAELHDEGKRDPRFQRRLRAERGDPVLAKSDRVSAQQSRCDVARSGLRSGWRHEQVSAAVAASRALEVGDADLVVRLVGTSHGRGRVEFDPPPADLLSTQLDALAVAAVNQLYGPTAGWHDVVENTERRWGVWACAYLEAVLRAADCQVSREGS